jgi:hypothetical protein
VAATNNVVADNNVHAGNSIVAGSPSVGYSAGDIVAADDLKAGKNVDALNDMLASRHIISHGGYLRTGNPSSSYGNGDIASTNDLIADGKVITNGISSISGGLTVKVYNNTLYYESSSARTKTEIEDLEDDFSKILDAEPRTFRDKNFGFRNIGYIAEELDALGLDNLVIYNEKDGSPKSIKYELISLYILEIVKQQQKEIERLKEEIESLQE